MADLTVETTGVVIRLDAFEAILAWRRELRLPIANLHMVQVHDAPLAGLHFCRFPGLCWPGLVAVGNCRRDGRREYVVAHSGEPAVALDLEGAQWDRVVVSHPDAVDIAADLAGLLLSRGSGHTPPRTFPATLD
jgi:hypothetical protein